MKKTVSFLLLVVFTTCAAFAGGLSGLPRPGKFQKKVHRLHTAPSKSALKTTILRRLRQEKRPPLVKHHLISAEIARHESALILSKDPAELNSRFSLAGTGLEANIQRYVFTIASENDPQQIIGSGFIFAQTTPDGHTRLWGATSGEVAKEAGENIFITFHTQNPDNFSYPARIVKRGNIFTSNVALIDVPEEVAEVALPVEINSTRQDLYNSQEATVYGFDRTGNLYSTQISPFFHGRERSLAQTVKQALNLSLSGGLVVDASGKVLGVYDRSYDASGQDDLFLKGKAQHFFEQRSFKLSYMGQFTPVRHLDYLLAENSSHQKVNRVLLFNGMQVGTIGLNEHISAMRVRYNDKPKTVVLQPTPFWSIDRMEHVVPALDKASQVEIFIDDPSKPTHDWYQIDLEKKEIKKRLTTSSPLPTAPWPFVEPLLLPPYDKVTPHN